MTDSNIDIIIARFLAHEASEEETLRLLGWLKTSDENERYFREQLEIWHRLHPAYTSDEVDVDKAEEKIVRRIRRRGIHGSLGRVFKMWSRVAAVLIVPLAAAVVWLALRADGAHDGRLITVAASYGCNSRFTLPDGSEVWLNSNSTLKYPPEPEECRTVSLAGEAYFSVRSDPDNPFHVITSDLQVTSTGTQFNVNAYDSIQSVTLVEGKLAVTAAESEWRMNPGEHLTLAGGNVAIEPDADIEKYCSWRQGMLVFADETLSFICSRMQQLFNYKIELDPAVADKRFHIILNGEDIHEFVYLLQLSEEVECEMSEETSGKDEQPKIAIRKNHSRK